MRAKLKLTQLNCKHGAPMGRPDVIPDWVVNQKAPTPTLHLRRMKMVDHDYDTGGAYWGGPCEHGCMWCAFSGKDTEPIQVFVRARTVTDAMRMVLDKIPRVIFS